MKAMDLLQAIGEVREEYIEEVFLWPSSAHPSRRRIPLTILVAVLILSALLASTAYASGIRVADWFSGLFTQVTEQEAQVLEDMAMGTPLTSTTPGGTATILSAFGDGYNGFFYLRFTSAEGVNLHRENLTDYSIYHQDYLDREDAVDLLSRSLEAASEAFSWTLEFQESPQANSLDALLHIALDPTGKLSFTDDTPETLTIPGLWYGSYVDHDQVMFGPWVFPLGKLGGESRELEVSHIGNDALQLNRLVVSQICLEVDATFLSPGNTAYPETGAVLLDGTYVSGIVGKYDRYYRTLTQDGCQYRLYFGAPVDLGEIDHVRVGNLIIPVSGDGTVVPNGELPQGQTQGTHVTLGDPDSLVLSPLATNPGPLTAQQDRELPDRQRMGLFLYAEYTQAGVRFYQHPKTGRLSITVTGARMVTDLKDLGGSYAGFAYDTYMTLDGSQWVPQPQPVCLNPDGSFKDGYRLLLVDLLVENQGATAYTSGNNSSPYAFIDSGFLTLTTLADPGENQSNYRNSNYLSDGTYTAPWENYFEILPGAPREIAVGFLLDPTFSWDLADCCLCNTSGNSDSVFIHLPFGE